MIAEDEINLNPGRGPPVGDRIKQSGITGVGHDFHPYKMLKRPSKKFRSRHCFTPATKVNNRCEIKKIKFGTCY